MTSLRISTLPQEGVYQASKWLKIPMLLDADEMTLFLNSLGAIEIFPLTGLTDGKPLSKDLVIAEYGRWIEGLKAGVLPNESDLRKILASAITDDAEHSLWLQEVQGRFLVKMSRPVVQMQAHFFTYSSVDGEFRSMSMGQDAVFWGIQCSFPQVYQDPKTMEILEVQDMGLFRKMQLWARQNTRATPFIVDGKRTNVPMRLGKQCFSWVNKHPQLQEKGWRVHGCV